MKSNKEQIYSNIEILPFGHISLQLKGVTPEFAKETDISPARYSESKTTNPSLIEIIFGGDIFGVPKSTAGVF